MHLVLRSLRRSTRLPTQLQPHAQLRRRTLTYVLGIETSCDDTAAAVLTGDGVVLSSVVSSQWELNAKWRGASSRWHWIAIATSD